MAYGYYLKLLKQYEIFFRASTYVNASVSSDNIVTASVPTDNTVYVSVPLIILYLIQILRQ